MLSRISEPGWLSLAFEPARAAAEAIWLQGIRPALPSGPHDHAHGVVIIPGFLGSDDYSRSVRHWLDSRGYLVSGWGQGTNRGPRPATFAGLADRVRALADETGEPVSLVGHSLGGIYAREISKDIPEEVRQVITLGSPLDDGREGDRTPVSQIFDAVNPGIARHWRRHGSIGAAPPVPTSTVFSMTDGIVGWKRSVQHNGHTETENIAILGSHGGMLHNAMAWLVLADRLSQPHGEWRGYIPASPLAGTVYDPTAPIPNARGAESE